MVKNNDSLVAQMGKASAHNVEDQGSIPRLGRSPGEGNSNPLQYSCLENSMNGGAWWATVHGVSKCAIFFLDVCLRAHQTRIPYYGKKLLSFPLSWR